MSAVMRAASRAPQHVEPIGRRNTAVESLRGIAALAVVGYHLAAITQWPRSFPPRLVLSNGDAGVTLFFVLSGFLLWRPFAAAALRGSGSPSLRQFAVNRALRILPAYWVALTVTLVLMGGTAPGGAWRQYLFLQNYSNASFFGGISPAWSLAVEAVFYLVLPVAGAVALALSRRGIDATRAVYGVIAAWFVLSFGYKLVAFAGQGLDVADVQFAFNFPAKAHLFAFGMLLATWHARNRERGPLGDSPWLPAAGAALVACSVAVRYRSAATALFFDSATAFGFALLVYAVVFDGARRTRMHAALEWRPLVAAGAASYSIYLWHHALIGWMAAHGILHSPFAWLLPNVFVTLIVTLTFAAGSYLLVERPFLNLRRRWI